MERVGQTDPQGVEEKEDAEVSSTTLNVMAYPREKSKRGVKVRGKAN